MDTKHTALEPYYQQIRQVILARQHPVTGLLPASTAVNVHGDYTDAWVRDNVYSILAVWGLALAYRKAGEEGERAFELEHSVVKLMRALLFAMMKQAPKVERFKQTQDPLDALHAKYDTATAEPVVADDAWGHLQLDATSLYLLMLAQMTASGVQIIYTLDEVAFVQNLIHTISRAYRTPDYGIWERGSKTNRGLPELNASSLAMAKAALEALAGFDLFGVRGSQASVLHVVTDDIARARITLEAMLPRESMSKEVDAALLSAVGFPAFAIDDPEIAARTEHEITRKLAGRYGFKRFLRDGHQSVIEDIERLHYEPEELKKFEHIESEWPLFFCYQYLSKLFQHDHDAAEAYRARIEQVLVERGGLKLLPELYYVPEDKLEAERQQPQSQPRMPNDNLPLVWAQSLYLLAEMIYEGLLTPSDLDPLGRHRHAGQTRQPVVQLAILAEDEALQAELAEQGVASETLGQVEGVTLRHAEDLSRAFEQLGRNDKLGLSGRPFRRLRSLATSLVYRLRGNAVLCLPTFFDPQQFYLALDAKLLVARLKGELAYIQRNWNRPGRPTVALLFTHDLLGSDPEVFLELLRELEHGEADGVPVRLAPLRLLMLAASSERIDELHDFRFQTPVLRRNAPSFSRLQVDPESQQPLSNTDELMLEVESDTKALMTRLQGSSSLYEQIEILATLKRLQSLDTHVPLAGSNVRIGELLEEVYNRAGSLKLWAVVRRAAGLLGKSDIGLFDAVDDLLVGQKHILIGKAYSEDALINRPMTPQALLSTLRRFSREDVRDQVLSQEVLIHLGSLMRAEPDLFEGMLTLRVGYLILLLTSELTREHALSQDEAYERLMRLSPYDVRERLRRVLGNYQGMHQLISQQESLHTTTPPTKLRWDRIEKPSPAQAPEEGWWHRRQSEGTVTRVPQDFYARVWQLLKHGKGLIIGDKLERRNRLDSAPILSETTPGETSFALRVEHLLNKIQAPEYRQLSIEALTVLSDILSRNPELQVTEYLVLDVLIGHAVRLAWLEQGGDDAHYEDHKADAWGSFYDLPPGTTRTYLAKAFRYLIETGWQTAKPPTPA